MRWVEKWRRRREEEAEWAERRVNALLSSVGVLMFWAVIILWQELVYSKFVVRFNDTPGGAKDVDIKITGEGSIESTTAVRTGTAWIWGVASSPCDRVADCRQST